jgi:hypothetical protein
MRQMLTADDYYWFFGVTNQGHCSELSLWEWHLAAMGLPNWCD